LGELVPSYVDALCREVNHYSTYQWPVHTIFFGGGTPSLLPVSAFEQIFDAIDSAFRLQPGSEISLEANPGTLSLSYLRSLHKLGFNRISLGMQSANETELRLLERQHAYVDVIHAVNWAHQAGFDNLNLDLIYGLPYQTLADWRVSIQSALDLTPQHLSLYALSVEEGTPMHRWVNSGRIVPPDPDLAADMYDLAGETLTGAGHYQYEISNWAMHAGLELGDTQNPVYACLHNLQYWRCQPYVGLGAGAHGYVDNMRISNVLRPQEYISRLNNHPSISDETQAQITPATESIINLDVEDLIAEAMIMGLRLTREGISKPVFRNRFQVDLQQKFSKEISQLIDHNLLMWVGDTLRLTDSSHLIANQVFVEFMPER